MTYPKSVKQCKKIINKLRKYSKSGNNLWSKHKIKTVQELIKNIVMLLIEEKRTLIKDNTAKLYFTNN